MRRIRKEEAYKKQEAIDNAINFVVGSVIFIVAGAGVVTGFYYLAVDIRGSGDVVFSLVSSYE